jgi:hypothetical protein
MMNTKLFGVVNLVGLLTLGIFALSCNNSSIDSDGGDPLETDRGNNQFAGLWFASRDSATYAILFSANGTWSYTTDLEEGDFQERGTYTIEGEKAYADGSLIATLVNNKIHYQELDYTNMASASEKSGVVTGKESTVDSKHNRTDVRVYLDTTGNGMADTVLGYKIKDDGKDKTVALNEFDRLIETGVSITFTEANAKMSADGFVRIIWHDVITVNGESMAKRFPNPYWFPFAFAKL